MGHKRIPVSLRIDDDLGEEFLAFFDDLKENRRLAAFIVELLRSYHESHVENNEVSMSDALAGATLFNPESDLQVYLDNVYKSHTESMRHSSMLAQQLSQTLNVVKTGDNRGGMPLPASVLESLPAPQAVTPTPQLQPEVSVVEENVESATEQRLSSVESKLNGFDNKLDELMTLLQNNLTQPQTPPQVTQPVPQAFTPVQAVQPVVQDTSPVTQVVQPVPSPESVFVAPVQVSNPVTSTPNGEESFGGIPTPNVQQVSQTSNVSEVSSGAPIFEGAPTTPIVPTSPFTIIEETSVPASPFTIVQEEEVKVEEEVSNKPASFGRAFGSLKKK